MLTKTSTVCIQDKNGKHYNTLCGAEYTAPEVRNMQRHIIAATKHPEAYGFIDLETAQIMVDGVPYKEEFTTEDSKLLKELGL